MTVALFVIAGLLLAALVFVALVYNALVRDRNAVATAWALVDTELQRRHDLVPNLVATVQGYATHERTVLEQVTAARGAAVAAAPTAEARRATEAPLVDGLRQLLTIAERYPDLKAGEQFLTLQHELADIEDRLAVARRIYNANVRDYNTAIQSFPGVLVANARDYRPATFFSVGDALRTEEPPSVGEVTAAPQ